MFEAMLLELVALPRRIVIDTTRHRYWYGICVESNEFFLDTTKKEADGDNKEEKKSRRKSVETKTEINFELGLLFFFLRWPLSSLICTLVNWIRP